MKSFQVLKLSTLNIAPNKSLWEAKAKKDSSWFWKGFVEVTKFINEKAVWIIGMVRKSQFGTVIGSLVSVG